MPLFSVESFFFHVAIQIIQIKINRNNFCPLFENKVLRRIFGHKRDEVTGEWRKLNKLELNDLYCSPSIVRVIKSRRIRWAGYTARMGNRKCA